jgi:pilus assembly protein Flp/PilA
MKSIFSRFFNDKSGATSIEYSLIAALIGIVIIAGVTQLGTNLSNKFSSIANSAS